MSLLAKKLRQFQLIGNFEQIWYIILLSSSRSWDINLLVEKMNFWWIIMYISSQDVVNALQTNDCSTTNVNVFFANEQ